MELFYQSTIAFQFDLKGYSFAFLFKPLESVGFKNTPPQYFVDFYLKTYLSKHLDTYLLLYLTTYNYLK